MSRRTVVHLVRHGEVDNPSKILYGRLPGFHLSEAGQRMADRLAEVLSRRDIAAIFASPLERAQETAQPLADKLGMPIETDDRLIEAENAFQGLTFGVGDGSLRRPEAWKLLRNPFLPSWGEPYERQADRMLSAATAAREVARGREAICVSHQLPIWVTRLRLEHRHLWHDPRHRQCGLASITSITYDGDRVVAISYSEPAADLVPPRGRRRGLQVGA